MSAPITYFSLIVARDTYQSFNVSDLSLGLWSRYGNWFGSYIEVFLRDTFLLTLRSEMRRKILRFSEVETLK